MSSTDLTPADASLTPATRWMVVISGGILMGLSLGIRHTQGLFMQPVTSGHGWSLETFGLALALQNLVWGLAQPVTGLVADRHGSGKVLCLGILAYGLGLYLMAQAREPAGFMAANGVLVGIALSGTAFGTVYGALSRIFEPRLRSWALAVAGAIGGLGQFCLVPFVQRLLAETGWRNTAIMLGLLVLASLPLAVPLRARPQERLEGVPDRPVGASVRDAMRRRGFWLLNLGFFACGFQLAFIATHLPAYLLEHGLSLEQAGTALALIALANIFGTYACGRSAGLWRVKHLLAGLYAVRVAAMLLFLSMPVTAASAYAFALVMGFLWLGTAPMTNELVLRMFGLRYIATLFGIVFLGHQVGGFFGVWLGAWVYDLTHSYDWLWIGAIVIGCVAAAAHCLIDDAPLAASDRPGLRAVRS
ncbi:MAG: MFS transporter [Castellaniella sp.]|nr:MFS transporter [Castellaniella sp.]